jgi:hypothetical protein
MTAAVDALVPPAPGPDGRRGLFVLALVGTVLRLALTWSGACDNRVVADDAFYYFTIARNVAAGLGVTFDGLAPTNGFHPLWLLMLTPVFALARALDLGPWVAVHLALSLGALLDVVSGVVLWRLLRRLGAPRGAHWAAAVWFLSPFTVLLSLRGMESALNVALFATWLAAVAAALGDRAPSARRGLAVGVVTGVAFLARTDNAPLLGAALTVATLAAVLARPPEGARRAWRGGIAFLAVAGLVTALLALPWFLWNLGTFGTPWQVSGAAKLANPQIFGHVPGDWPNRLRFLGAPVWVPSFFVAGETMKQRPAFSAVAAAVWIVLGALLPFLVRALWRPRTKAQLVVATALGTYVAAHTVVYVFVLRTYVVWYAFLPVVALVVLFVGLGADRLLGRMSAPGRVAAAALALLAGLAIYGQYYRTTRFVPRGEELVVRPVLARIAREAPGTRTIGIFNAGAAGYFAPEVGPLTVVNLDGLVNNEAVAAWRAGDYLGYLERNVDVVVNDADRLLNHLLGGPGDRARFDQRYPRWPRSVMIHGPQLQEPVRPDPRR